LLDVYGEDLAQTLYRQYRMHESIAEFASQEFYDGRLEHGENNRAATIDGLTSLLAIDDNSGEAQNSGSNSYHNPTEAQYVVAQVQRALNHDVDASDIGVITGYSEQREIIRSKLVSSIENLDYDSVDVETIDKFQGGQREVIIVSFTRSNSENDSGFLESPSQTARKRLNVAITRAKKRLVLIGDWETLSTPAGFRDPSESCADTFARLRDYLQDRDCMVTNRS
jgi:superfamily I DNA and/or RNA helicase